MTSDRGGRCTCSTDASLETSRSFCQMIKRKYREVDRELVVPQQSLRTSHTNINVTKCDVKLARTVPELGSKLPKLNEQLQPPLPHLTQSSLYSQLPSYNPLDLHTMAFARARALRTLQSSLRFSGQRVGSRVSAPARTQLVARRYASGGAHGAESSSDLPW